RSNKSLRRIASRMMQPDGSPSQPPPPWGVLEQVVSEMSASCKTCATSHGGCALAMGFSTDTLPRLHLFRPPAHSPTSHSNPAPLATPPGDGDGEPFSAAADEAPLATKRVDRGLGRRDPLVALVSASARRTHCGVAGRLCAPPLAH